MSSVFHWIIRSPNHPTNQQHSSAKETNRRILERAGGRRDALSGRMKRSLVKTGETYGQTCIRTETRRQEDRRKDEVCLSLPLSSALFIRLDKQRKGERGEDRETGEPTDRPRDRRYKGHTDTTPRHISLLDLLTWCK